jgi:hypothetical protein
LGLIHPRVTDSGSSQAARHTGAMKSLLIVLALAALVLLILGVAVETLKFLLYVGLVVLVASVALFVVQRIRSGARS